MNDKFINKMNGLEKGKALFEKEEYYDSIIELSDFLKANTDNADALYTRAMCYRKTVDYEKSVADLTTILTRLPNEPTLLCDRGISHFHNKNVEAALKDMDQAIELDPNNPYRYSSRAFIRAEVDVKGAMEDYEKAIELDPKDEISLNNLGLLLENAGKMKAAKKNYDKSNELIDYDPKKRQEKTNETQELKNQKKPSQDSLGKVMMSVFKSKETRKEYFNFLKAVFRKSS